MSDAPGRRDRLSTDRWQRVQDVFAAAIECEAAARAQLVRDRCGDDPDVRREVESLLVSHDQPGLVDRLATAIAPATAWARTQVAGWEGRRVAQYSILELVDAGGMGVVYKAHDARLGRQVALKFLPPHVSSESAWKERFLVEARAAAALDHPNICTIFEIGETGEGQLFLAMPLYDGETVGARLTRGRLRFDEAMPIAVQIARGVGAAHARGVVHRDIKPSNVMILRDGTVKILDFGIATIEDVSIGAADARFGTLAYMSPEHISGTAIDHRSDVWSLGVLVHEMLTARRPFNGVDGAATAEAILHRVPHLSATSHPDVPAAIDTVLRRALAKHPDDRYPSMTAFATDLMALQSSAAPALTSGAEPSAAPLTERRRTAVLVTLVSDYGSLIERMTPLDAQRVVAEIRDTAVDAVRRHGGIVNQAIAEEIVSVFGVPAAHDDDELRAVRAAIELHARVREMAARSGAVPAVHVQSGLHTGSVVAQRLNEGPRRYAIVGGPSTVASRLAALAAPGDTVLSPECQRLLSPFVQTAPCAPILLEPDACPVTPFRVTGQTGLETRLEASSQSGLTPYVGRESNLTRLEEHVAAVRRGNGRVIEIVGEAGLGKSRLLYELRARVSGTEGLQLVAGRCRAFGDVAPYGPFIEIVRALLRMGACDAADSRDLVTKLRATDASLEPYIPLYLHLLSATGESHPLPRHLQGEHLQAALVDAVAALLTAVSKRVTLVVLLEDWHWADNASRAVLARMSEVVSADHLLVIVTARPEAAGIEERPSHAERMILEPLDFAASAAVIEASLGAGRVAEQLAHRVFERTGGNPFFLEQVCRALVEEGAVTLRDGDALVQGGLETLSLPDTVQAVIRTRLDNLEPRTREVVRVAAAFGREFEYHLLSEVVGAGFDLDPPIERLVTAGLIRQTSHSARAGYRFTHVLTQEVSYESLLAHQRRSMHEAIGRAIERHQSERLDEQALLLAHHYSRAEAWRDAVHYGRRAADRASRLSQFSDAFDTLEQVLTWLPHLPDDEETRRLRADLLLRQERACETMGLRRRQQEIIRQLIAHLAPAGQSAHLAEAYLREGDLLTLLKRFSAADRALSTALRISRELNDVRLERNIVRSLGLLRWHEGRNADALTLTEHAVSIDRECGDEDGLAGDMINVANVYKTMGNYSATLACIEEALAIPSVAENPKKLVYALQILANAYRGLGNLEATLAALRRADETSAHLLPIQRSFHLMSIAHIELQQGHIDQAIRTYRHAIDLSRRARHAEGLAQALRALGEVLFELARHEESLPYLVEAAHLFAQLEDEASEAEMWTHAATGRERTGSHADALDAWTRVQALCRESGDANGQLNALDGIARTTRQMKGPTDASVAAFEAALAMASTLGDWPRALACRNTLGILEWTRQQYPAALTHYEAALALARDQGDPIQEGVILNGLGVTLSKLNRLEEARTVLEASVALNRRTGQTLFQAHALTGLGHVSRTLQQVDRAVEQFKQSLELRRAAGDRSGEAWMWRRLAEAYLALGNHEAAQDAVSTSVRVAAASGDPEVIAACAAALSP